MDGVLWHSCELHQQAFGEALKDRVGEFSYRLISGMRTREAMEKILFQNGVQASPILLSELAERKSEVALSLLREHRPVDPDCQRVLEHSRHHYRLALATSAGGKSVDLFLEITGSRAFFEAIVHGDLVRNAKPDPEVYLTAARELHVSAERCLVIEDSEHGLEAARRAGMKAVLVGNEKVGDAAHVGYVQHLGQLLEIL